MLICFDRYARAWCGLGPEWAEENESRATRAHDWADEKVLNGSRFKLLLAILRWLITTHCGRWMEPDMEARRVKYDADRKRKELEFIRGREEWAISQGYPPHYGFL